ncbi:MAG: hypothetical protein JXA73_14145 [Acidobacteria bacterium]|nr:hypothetical protein [Acidobacteriota bacterium]
MNPTITLPFWAQYGAIAFFLASALCCLYVKKRWAGPLFLFLGFILHSWFLWSVGHASGMFLPNTMVSLEIFMPWGFSAMVLLHLLFSDKKRTVNSAVILILIFAIAIAGQTRVLLSKNVLIYPPGPTHPVGWVTSFFLIESLAYVAFFLACWYAFQYAKGNREAGFFHSYIIASFVLFSISQVVGAVWSYLGWAVPFHLSSDRHFISAAFWLFLALYLHLKFLPNWPARKRAQLVALSFFAVFYFRYIPYFLSNLSR